MKKLFEKYREIIVYLIVGVLTTIVSWGACFVAKFFLDSDIAFQNFVINTIGWVVGVVFAYPLNRKWVFKSTNKHIIKEFFGFAASRLSTWILDIVIMYVFINLWTVFLPLCTKLHTEVAFIGNMMSLDKLHYWFVKIFISAVLVTILNYVFSKVLIFGKKKGKKGDEGCEPGFSYDPAVKKPVLKCSVCNGEQVAGFTVLETGAFEEEGLIRNEKDLADFKNKYGIEGDIEKIY